METSEQVVDFHITKLFTGSLDTVTPNSISQIRETSHNFVGRLYPDGHVWIIEGAGIFRLLLHMYQQQEGPLYYSFEQQHPQGMVSVRLIETDLTYQGHRVPTSFPVPVDILWLDYDQHFHKLRVFKDRRRPYETYDEFELRRNELKPSSVIELDSAPYQVQFTTDEGTSSLLLVEPTHLLA